MKKFILILILILLAAFLVFNFYAANQAEKQIDTIIQQQADSSATPVSVEYSSINVSPFRGNIDFENATVVERSNIERSKKVHVDLGYLDFLNIYFGGLKYGLQHLSKTTVTFQSPSYINRSTLQEVTLDTLHVHYTGNMWDGLNVFLTQKPAAYRHDILFNGTKLSYNQPQAPAGTFKSDTASFHFVIPKQATGLTGTADHTMSLKNITWTPPATVQKKYGFFIQGFGYPLNAIPIQQVKADYRLENPSTLTLLNGTVTTDLFKADLNGMIQADSSWATTRLNPLNVSMYDFSHRFKNVLANIEQLFQLQLPEKNGRITFQLAGPVSNLRSNMTDGNTAK